MTALTPREFDAALTELTPTFAPIPPAYAHGECDTCGENTQVRITNTGLACQDCYDTDPEPYDPFDCYEHQDDGWGW